MAARLSAVHESQPATLPGTAPSGGRLRRDSPPLDDDARRTRAKLAQRARRAKLGEAAAAEVEVPAVKKENATGDDDRAHAPMMGADDIRAALAVADDIREAVKLVAAAAALIKSCGKANDVEGYRVALELKLRAERAAA